MEPDTKARLEAILAHIQRLRSSIYPPGWDADPLYRVEQELVSLLNDIKFGKGPDSAPKRE